MKHPADTYVRARIDPLTKRRAESSLRAMGLSVSDAIRLLMRRVAAEKRLPFEIREPNAESRRAKTDLEQGRCQRFASVDALMADLQEDD